MIKINLLPPEIYVAEVRKQLRAAGIALGGVVVAVLMGIWGLRMAQAGKLETQLADAEGELRKYQAIAEKVNALEQTRNQLRARRDVIQQLLVGRLLYPRLFEDFMTLLPPEVWINSLSTRGDASNALDISLSAQSVSNFAIADWLTNLQTSPLCSNVVLGPISASEQGQGRPAVLSFTITFKYLRKDA